MKGVKRKSNNIERCDVDSKQSAAGLTSRKNIRGRQLSIYWWQMKRMCGWELASNEERWTLENNAVMF